MLRKIWLGRQDSNLGMAESKYHIRSFFMLPSISFGPICQQNLAFRYYLVSDSFRGYSSKW
jgi:hypothetical protein